MVWLFQYLVFSLIFALTYGRSWPSHVDEQSISPISLFNLFDSFWTDPEPRQFWFQLLFFQLKKRLNHAAAKVKSYCSSASSEGCPSHEALSVLVRFFSPFRLQSLLLMMTARLPFYFHLWTLLLFISLHSHYSLKRKQIKNISKHDWDVYATTFSIAVARQSK